VAYLVPLYLIGMAGTWIGAAVYWCREFYRGDPWDLCAASIWGFLLALIWPLIWLAAVPAAIVKVLTPPRR